jgi:hypothetical protein
MYEVAWSEAAYRDLGLVWDRLPHLHPHLRIARQVAESYLSQDPYLLSEGRENDTIRILFVYPLAFLFVVNPEVRKVIVIAVWSFQLPKSS